MMEILNLYAGIGGNRKLWGKEHKVTAVENNPDIAEIYKKIFPKDEVIIEDAHEFLLKNFKKFDFIWSSPPCQTHSSFRKNICVAFRGTKPKYPDMKLYEEILFLQGHAKCKWVVENVKPYYKFLIEPSAIIDRHLFWSNFKIKESKIKREYWIRHSQIKQLQEMHGFNLSKFKIKDKRQILRNCVLPKLGKHILRSANGN